MSASSIKDATKLIPSERDVALFDDDQSWNKTTLQMLQSSGWTLEAVWGQHHVLPTRLIQTGATRDFLLREVILRFPSAPIYGIHRQLEFPLRRILNVHSLRLLERSDRRRKRASRVYLICNGLNEVDHFGFYYQLAGLLLSRDPDAVVLVRPFPGHLSRFVLPGRFAETPLNRYLGDAGNLYRQFLRYMVESRWIISALVPHRCYRVVSGCDLLLPGHRRRRGRASSEDLANEISREWDSMYTSSRSRTPRIGPNVNVESVLESLQLVRAAVGWKEDTDYERPVVTKDLARPGLHLIGYSLGGFMSQSIFFAFPYAVSSCTTVAAGGELRDVAPTVFAHPEEWSSVLHGMRYEIEDSMLRGRLCLSDSMIAGVDEGIFSYFLQVFYEVFLQDFRGEYRTRVREHVDRLFFVVGGADPIVQVRNVQAASPDCGINLLEIANLDHFVHRQDIESWGQFWLPLLGRILSAFAKRSEEVHARAIYPNWYREDMSGPLRETRSNLAKGREEC